jgi:hypothetical protein
MTKIFLGFFYLLFIIKLSFLKRNSNDIFLFALFFVDVFFNYFIKLINSIKLNQINNHSVIFFLFLRKQWRRVDQLYNRLHEAGAACDIYVRVILIKRD